MYNWSAKHQLPNLKTVEGVIYTIGVHPWDRIFTISITGFFILKNSIKIGKTLEIIEIKSENIDASEMYQGLLIA